MSHQLIVFNAFNKIAIQEKGKQNQKIIVVGVEKPVILCYKMLDEYLAGLQYR